MTLPNYFLRHPVIALILNAMILIIGTLCFNALSLREYPEIHFPNVTIFTNYPNASAELVETSITYILEEQLAGIEGIDSITSNSKHGRSTIELNFKNGTSIDRAMLAIREAIGLARGQLPQEVKDPVVERKTVSSGMPFIVLSLESTSMDFAALTHYANLNLKNAFRGVKGVASAEVWGQPYTYDIVLNPKKMYTFGVNTDEVFDAIQRNNLSLPVGKFQNETPTTLNAELKNLTDYENLVVKEKDLSDAKHKHNPVLLKNIADITLKTDNERFRVRINGKPGLAIAINRTNDGNPLEVSTLVQKKLNELKTSLPQGLDIKIISDQADFVRSSLYNIKSSIFEAILFVLIIVFLFLRNLKATLIPLVTIPISLMGSFLFLKLFGYSINILTLMAMVLAVGLVVDDAIVMLENIQRHIDNGLSAFAAALKGSKEIGFAIVAMTLTLTSVYAPLAFITGTIGQLFSEFAVALAGSVFISGIVALTLSPLMCAKTLSKKEKPLWPIIDVFLEKLAMNYRQILTKVIYYKKTCIIIILSLFALIFYLAQWIPNEMAPKEDRNLIGVYLPPIPGKDINTMEEKLQTVEKIVQPIKDKEAESMLIFMGDWGGTVVLPLKPQTKRDRSASAIVNSLRPLVTQLPSADVYPWSWDSGLPGMDDSMTGSELSLTVSTTDTYRQLFDHVEHLRNALDSEKLYQSVRHDLKLDTPGYRIDLFPNETSNLNLTSRQLAKTIEVFFSGDKSLTFSKDGILYNLTLKGEKSPWSLNELYVTNHAGKRISLAAVANLVQTAQPDRLFHYNQMRSATLTADLMQGDKIESAMVQLKTVAAENLPSSYKMTWQGAAKAYSESQMMMTILFLLALVFIFAILSAQFENFIDPFIILFTIPLACAGALSFVWMSGQSMNIYTQVGLITLIGLISKHGILIVEFANQLRKNNIPLLEAIIQSASLRLRPILMTTGAMIFGAIPLLLSHDAGYESRHVIGTVLIGGLSCGTLFTLFVLPTVYLFVKQLEQKWIL